MNNQPPDDRSPFASDRQPKSDDRQERLVVAANLLRIGALIAFGAGFATLIGASVFLDSLGIAVAALLSMLISPFLFVGAIIMRDIVKREPIRFTVKSFLVVITVLAVMLGMLSMVLRN